MLNWKQINDIDAALERIRTCCPQITYVSLLGNPGCPDQLTNPGTNDEDDYERYRLYATYVLPETLRFLDSRQVTKREQIIAKSRGRFLKTVRLDTQNNPFSKSSIDNEFDEADFHVNYTPLPTAARSPLDHKGTLSGVQFLQKFMLRTWFLLQVLMVSACSDTRGRIRKGIVS